MAETEETPAATSTTSSQPTSALWYSPSEGLQLFENSNGELNVAKKLPWINLASPYLVSLGNFDTDEAPEILSVIADDTEVTLSIIQISEPDAPQKKIALTEIPQPTWIASIDY